MNPDKQLEAALRRMDKLEDEIRRLKGAKESNHKKKVVDRGGVVYKVGRDGSRHHPTIVLPPQRKFPEGSKRESFWAHVATHQ